jgi:hypothetical protein
MSIKMVLIVADALLKVGGTGFLSFSPRASKKTNQPSFRRLCFMYVDTCAGPGISFPFKTLSSTTWSNPEEKVTNTSTNPMPEVASRIRAPRLSSLAFAKRPKHSWPRFSGRFRNFLFERESQKELTASDSMACLNPSRKVRMLIRRRRAMRRPEASTFSATALGTKNSLLF